MNSSLLVALAVLGLALVVALGVLAYRREQAREQALRAWAAAGGWQLVDEDDRWAQAFDGPPFGVGEDPRAQDVCTGTRGGYGELAFTYCYATYRTVTSTGPNGQMTTTRQREEHDVQVVAMRLPVVIGPVQVVPEGLGQRFVTALGGQDVEIEHADFNRRQRVTAASPKLATDLLSPRVVEQLLTHEDVSLRVAEGWALAWTPGRLSGPGVDDRLAMLRAVVDGIPRFVWLDHGHDPGTLASPLRKEAP